MIIRTIAGDIEPSELGRTNYHEHAFQISPLLKGDELDDLAKSCAEFKRLRSSGFDAYVDATPIGLGRNLEAIQRLGLDTGLKIVHTTGVHRQAHYPADSALLSMSVDQLAEIFHDEIQFGMKDGSGVTSNIKAGLIKFGIDNEKISEFENRALDAAGQVSNKLGVGLMVHIESGSFAHEVLDRLEKIGVAPSRVALAHMDRKPDAILHVEIASRGAYLGHDGAGRTKYFPDETLVELFSAVIAAGHSSQILLGADVARASRYVEYGGGPGLEYLGNTFLPQLISATSEKIVNQVLTNNPQRWLAFTP